MLVNEKSLPLLALAGLVGLSTACAEERSFYIFHNQPIPGSCDFTVDETNFVGRGTPDVSFGRGYIAVPLLKSALQPTAGAADNQPERNNIDLRYVKVSLDLSEIPNAGAPSVQTNFAVQFGGGILAPGAEKVIVVEVIPAAVAKALKNKVPESTPIDPKKAPVGVHFSFVGTRLGTDSEVESAGFTLPVDVCNKCLKGTPAKVDTCASKARKDCDTAVRDDCVLPAGYENPCGLAQDAYVITDKDGNICATGK